VPDASEYSFRPTGWEHEVLEEFPAFTPDASLKPKLSGQVRQHGLTGFLGFGEPSQRVIRPT